MFMSITVYKLLLREGQEFSIFSKVGTLEGTNGGESPACAAMSLVLNWGNTTFLNPVDVIGRNGPMPRGEIFLLFRDLVEVLN